MSAPQRCEISQGDPVLTHGFHRKVGVATCAVPILGRKNWLDPRSSPGNASLHIFHHFSVSQLPGGTQVNHNFRKRHLWFIPSILLPSDATEWSIYEDERREPVNHQGHRGIIFSDVLLCITGKIESLETCAVENLGSATIPDLIVFFQQKKVTYVDPYVDPYVPPHGPFEPQIFDRRRASPSMGLGEKEQTQLCCSVTRNMM